MTARTSRTRARKVRALAAAGLVVGTGAALVLAGWTESLFVAAGFGTAPFSVEGDIGSGWQRYPDAGNAAELPFPVAVQSMRPGDAAYAPISVRVGADSLAASVTLEGASGSGQFYSALRYRVIESATCGAPSFTSGTFIVGSPSSAQPLNASSAQNIISLPAGAAGNPGAHKTFCFELSLPNTAANWTTPGIPGAQLTVNWKFAAQSTT
ncbi:hypothetical protein ONR57_09205 [Hoyosella sp. YIM 151337]|uniref:hypothetical protein n=1 Tax=Hoyosella sp. YIM 151337 TaxID=2992742 RepID=UPI0022359332|nr:hypothetical protein [Hoyosella sp. YIM 151337]MCW4353472.1 hypothetical protein [Hoyosella sp. YIM 151337]